MKNMVLPLVFGSSVFLFACNASNEADIEFKSFSDFQSYIMNKQDESTRNCGVVESGADYLNVNTCVAESFVNKEPFVAIYELQGFDSSVGLALSMFDNLDVTVWNYDSNPCGGIPACDSEIHQNICSNPELSGILDVPPSELFSCE